MGCAHGEFLNYLYVLWTGITDWPPGSGNKSNNIVLNLGDCAGGGCGTGITMDTESPTAEYSRFKWFGADEVRMKGSILVAETFGQPHTIY